MPAREVKVSDNSSTCLDEDAIDTPGTLAGKRERAPVERVMGSDRPTQSIDKTNRLGDIYLDIAMDKEVAKEHAHWRWPEMEDKSDTHTRMGSG